MEENLVHTSVRNKPRGALKDKGFVAGVLYGDGIAGGSPVAFDAAELLRVMKFHGSKARVSIMINNSTKMGVIKEVQRDPISQKITHIDVQIVAKDQEVKLQVPIIFKGEETLAERELQLQIYKQTITLSGRMDWMPEVLTVDVSDMLSGDSITVAQFNLDQRVKVGDKEDSIYAVIINQPVVPSAPSPPVEEDQ